MPLARAAAPTPSQGFLCVQAHTLARRQQAQEDTEQTGRGVLTRRQVCCSAWSQLTLLAATLAMLAVLAGHAECAGQAAAGYAAAVDAPPTKHVLLYWGYWNWVLSTHYVSTNLVTALPCLQQLNTLSPAVALLAHRARSECNHARSCRPHVAHMHSPAHALQTTSPVLTPAAGGGAAPPPPAGTAQSPGGASSAQAGGMRPPASAATSCPAYTALRSEVYPLCCSCTALPDMAVSLGR